jgi:hypothetical protein
MRTPAAVTPKTTADVLGLIGAVAATERRLNLPVLAVHPRPDVEHVIVVGQANVHRIGRRRAFGRLLLGEVGDRRCRQPDFLIEAAVNANRSVRHTRRRRLLAISCAADRGLGKRG